MFTFQTDVGIFRSQWLEVFFNFGWTVAYNMPELVVSSKPRYSDGIRKIDLVMIKQHFSRPKSLAQ